MMFEDFFHAQKDGLLRVMRVITGSRAEAEDITQEVFLPAACSSGGRPWREDGQP